MLEKKLAILGDSIFAKERGSRPIIQAAASNSCPFCIANKSMIDYIWLEKTIDQDQIRIVNNKYPMVHNDGSLYGYHDVVIDTISHTKMPKDFSTAHWHTLLLAIQEHMVNRSQDSRIQFIQLFKNQGMKAGASIAHSHWQMVSLEQTPIQKDTFYSQLKQYKKENNHCLLCSLLMTLDKDYIIDENAHWIAFAALQPLVNYETWIIVKNHTANFVDLSATAMLSLANSMKYIITQYEKQYPGVDYNIILVDGPVQKEEDHHLFFRILPRTSSIAGFELATGCFIYTIDPKEHATIMREEK